MTPTIVTQPVIRVLHQSFWESCRHFVRTIKGQALLVLLALLAVAAGLEPVSRTLLAAHVSVAILSASVLDAAYLRLETGRWRLPTSALLTGLIVAMILAPGTSLDIVAVACLVGILGKHLMRVGHSHVFNPAVLGLLWVGWQFGTGQSWWGALSNAPLGWIVVLIASGWFIVDRLNKLPTVLAFLGIYIGLWTLASFSPTVDGQLAAEMIRTPFIHSAIYLAFFMLTDPPTSPNRYLDQACYGAIAAVGAVLASLAGAGQLYLLFATLAANVWLVGRRVSVRRGASRHPATAEPALRVKSVLR